MSIFDIFRSKESILERKITKVYTNAVKTALSNSGGIPMMEGIMVFHAISSAYKNLKENSQLQTASGLSHSEYQDLIKRIMNRIGRKEISNWDDMFCSTEY